MTNAQKKQGIEELYYESKRISTNNNSHEGSKSLREEIYMAVKKYKKHKKSECPFFLPTLINPKFHCHEKAQQDTDLRVWQLKDKCLCVRFRLNNFLSHLCKLPFFKYNSIISRIFKSCNIHCCFSQYVFGVFSSYFSPLYRMSN